MRDFGSEPGSKLASGESTRLGATALFLAPDRTCLPRGCKTILEVSDRGADGRLIDSAGDIHTIPLLDRAPLAVAEEAAAALAPVRPRRVAASSTLPLQAALLDLLGVQAVEERQADRRAPDRVGPGGQLSGRLDQRVPDQWIRLRWRADRH